MLLELALLFYTEKNINWINYNFIEIFGKTMVERHSFDKPVDNLRFFYERPNILSFRFKGIFNIIQVTRLI